MTLGSASAPPGGARTEPSPEGSAGIDGAGPVKARSETSGPVVVDRIGSCEPS